ncbi:hypothetical protein RvY_11824 [Ramazzottius varieornatus]|uniref:LRRCT domain-containing protein n=1 Tax=Ramazzottius varieornatus TaxID=947166 RepID=A0A1D1VLP5_RAMVA|nr:hypothetical protein RvY_11824 [Ramazzottius varieornatus]
MKSYSRILLCLFGVVHLVISQKPPTISLPVKRTPAVSTSLDACSLPCELKDDHACNICSDTTFSCPNPSSKLKTICSNYVNASTTEITVINVQNNALTDFSSFPASLPKLSELNVMGNPFSAITKADLARFPALQMLDISDIRLTLEALPEDIFESVPLLQDLTIRSSGLRTLPPNIFKNNKKLTKLVLEGNRMEKVPADALKKVGYSLRALFLSGNPITKVDASDFDYLVELRTLYLKDTNIRQIKDYTFAALDKMTDISLDHNVHLEFIHEDAFGNHAPEAWKFSGSLERVSIRNCALRSLDVHTVNVLYLKELLLSGNPWQCDCTIKWMVDKDMLEKSIGHEKITEELKKTKCMDAPHRDMFIGTLPEDRFVCLDELRAIDTTVGQRIAGGLGGTAILVITVILCVSAIVFSAILLRKITLRSEQTRVHPAAAHQYQAIYNQGSIQTPYEERPTRHTALLKDPFEI